MSSLLRTRAIQLSSDVQEAGGRAFFVGGCVRDKFLGLEPKDFDLEVYGLSAEKLQAIVGNHGAVHLVGVQFAVLLVSTPDGEIEVSLPRRESNTGPGHRGFVVSADPDMTHAEASLRRDFTINCMLEDPFTGEIIDCHGGLADIEAKLLRHVSPAFREDPLRVLRVGRFMARFGKDWSVHPETVAFCREIDLSELPVERIEGEWKEILLNGAFPGRGLLALEECGALEYFPELKILRDTPQDPEWHPEGDVLIHTALCLDAAVEKRDEMEDAFAEMLGVLCHDLGKATTTEFVDGHIRSHRHDIEGVAPTKSLLARLSRRSDLARLVVPLVKCHLLPFQFHEMGDQLTDAAIRRLSLRVSIPALCRVSWADAAGRGEKMNWQDWPAGDWLLARAEAVGVIDGKPRPFLMGRHLIDLGVKPGRRLGRILEQAYELQLDGNLKSEVEAQSWAEARIKK
ncbi:MAG: polynucleotide adenylyltransferase [Planctomycetes bacterium]|nr:polynucleotide adenylyltransferase [Planctomycetota bacterium]